jgi:endonuclease YncB( thermonuclease family)
MFKKLLIISSVLISTSAYSADIESRIFRDNLCYDGDTCYITMPALPKELKNMSVRILGIDTPEMKGKCDKEKALAQKAKEFANNAFKNAKTIEYKNLQWDKYGGRVLANVYLDGVLYSDQLIKANLARPYFGEEKKSWCD